MASKDTIPSHIYLGRFAAARINEIKTLQKAIQSQTGNRTIFQLLPRHMRRRVMGHTVKRLPKSLQAAYAHQLKKSGDTVQKAPNRAKRRKKRHGECKSSRWLETHIWHAKRFHMVDRWGCKIPYKRCDKSFRALYRASAHHCLIQDYSYYSCIEISGGQELLDKLSEVTNRNIGLTPKAVCYRSGCREGTTTIFKPGKYPLSAIGTVQFQWKCQDLNAEKETIWIWSHPSFKQELIEMFCELFNVTYNPLSDEYSNEKFTMKNLETKLSRFRLTGPLSFGVLKQALIPSTIQTTLDNSWLVKHFSNDFIRQQTDFWDDLNVSSPAELPPGCIIGLNVIDPRVNLPCKRTKATNQSNGSVVGKLDKCLSRSFVWDGNERDACIGNKPSDLEIRKRNSEKLVPGVRLDGEKFASFPVMVVQRPGPNGTDLGYASGFDVILPRKFSRELWLTMIMWGARSGGLVEDRVVTLECLRGDILQPDTKSYREYYERVFVEKKEEYFQKPPKKRLNFIKLGMASPFKNRWDLLMKEWNGLENGSNVGSEDFYVLRDKGELKKIQIYLKTPSPSTSESFTNQNVLVPVKLIVRSRSLIKNNAIICLPDHDNDSFNKQIKETVHPDPNAQERRTLRLMHKKQLLRLKRKRHKIRIALNEINTLNRTEKNESENVKVTELKKQLERCSKKISIHREMESLWMPEPKTIRNQCSRETIGLVTHGDFSFRLGKSAAVGFIALKSLSCLRNNCVLLRNISSYNYHFAEMDVIC